MRLIFANEERAMRAETKVWEDWTRELCNEMAEKNRRYDALLEMYHALKASGAAIPTAPVKRPADRVLEVIADVAGSNAPLRSMLGRYARQERAKRVDDDTIIKVLMHWPDADDDDSQTDDMTT